MNHIKSLNLDIGGQRFSLKVREEDAPVFEEAASLVTKKMEQIGEKGEISLHRKALLTALQMAYEYLVSQPVAAEGKEQKNYQKKLVKLINKVEDTLQKNKAA